MVDGANFRQRIWYIVIPHLAPLFVFITMIHVMDAYRIFEPILVFGSNLFANSLQHVKVRRNAFDFLFLLFLGRILSAARRGLGNPVARSVFDRPGIKIKNLLVDTVLVRAHATRLRDCIKTRARFRSR